MSSYLSILAAYILGGLTFIPLILALLFLHAYYLLPTIDLDKQDLRNDDVLPTGPFDKTALPLELQKPDRERDTAAGYFAICREYVPGGVNGKPPERLTPAGEVIAVESPSVYQTMYRSIFDRNKAQGPSLEVSGGNVKATKRARNVFYVVLRLGHMMLYDNADQLEVRHVISLGLYHVDVYGGGEQIREGELWVKRNCIRLRRRTTDATMTDSKPYFLFADNCSEKEDFFHALVQSQHRSSNSDSQPVLPLRFDSNDMVTLIQQLHGSEELMQTRWFNAVIGRMFLSLYKTAEVQFFVHKKITKKLARMHTPSFIEDIKVGRIDMGQAAPLFTNPKLRELTLDGELVVEMDVKYSGNFRLEIAAAVLIDLGQRFKVRRIDILLAGILKSLTGHLLVKIKPPPANRIWISFETMPKMDMSIEPLVSARQITYGIILRTIESKIREALGETLVYPNWDDIPFSHTEGHPIRGGLWHTDAYEHQHPHSAPAKSNGHSDSHKKKHTSTTIPQSHSTPSLVRRRPTENSKLPKTNTDLADNVITSGRASPASSSRAKAMRSSSFTGPASPVVSMNPTTASALREDAQFTMQDAAASMKGLSTRSSSMSSIRAREVQDLGHADSPDGADVVDDGEERDVFSLDMPFVSTPRTSQDLQRPSDHGDSSDTAIEGVARAPTEDFEKKRRTIVQGAQVATAVARKWGYDFVTKRAVAGEGSSPHESTSDLSSTASVQSMPIGRGQPLPPIGTPLPGPASRKSWANAFGSITKMKTSAQLPAGSNHAGLTATSTAARQATAAKPRHHQRTSADSSKDPQDLPALPPRRANGHSRQGSAMSKKSQTLSIDEPTAADDVLVIKAPQTDAENTLKGRVESPEKVAQTGHGLEASASSSESEKSSAGRGDCQGTKHSGGAGHDVDKDKHSGLERSDRSRSTGSDKESLEMLQALVH